MRRLEPRSSIESLPMPRKVAYSFLLVASLTLAVSGGMSYLHDILLGLTTIEHGYFDLAKLLCGLLGGMVAASVLTRGDHGKSATKKESPAITDPDVETLSLTLQRLPTTVTLAFSRRPILSTLLALLFIAIPFLLVAMATPGGLKALGAGRWLGVILAEVPIILVAFLTLLSRFRRR
jgi:hypothetical protein